MLKLAIVLSWKALTFLSLYMVLTLMNILVFVLVPRFGDVEAQYLTDISNDGMLRYDFCVVVVVGSLLCFSITYG